MPTQGGRHLAAATASLLVAVALLLGVPFALPGRAIGALAPLCVDAAAQHHATVVVNHLDPRLASPVRVCVGFDEDHITGHQLLDRSGLKAGFGGYSGNGTAVCQVDGEPETYPPDCLRADQPYWSIWQASYHGGWAYARFGLDGVTIHDGDAEGFRYARNQGAPDDAGAVCPPPATAAPPPSGGTGPATQAPAAPAAPATVGSAQPPGRLAGSGRPTADDPLVALATPGTSPSPTASPEVALNQSPPLQSFAHPPARPAVTTSRAGGVGLAVAVIGAVGLLLLLAIQALLPRLRR